MQDIDEVRDGQHTFMKRERQRQSEQVEEHLEEQKQQILEIQVEPALVQAAKSRPSL